MSELGAASWKRRGQILKERPIPEEPKRSNHKDTKKWCKGVKGRQHDYKWQLSNKFPTSCEWYEDVCQKCSKHRNYCVSMDWTLSKICKCGFHKKVENG